MQTRQGIQQDYGAFPSHRVKNCIQVVKGPSVIVTGQSSVNSGISSCCSKRRRDRLINSSDTVNGWFLKASRTMPLVERMLCHFSVIRLGLMRIAAAWSEFRATVVPMEGCHDALVLCNNRRTQGAEMLPTSLYVLQPR